MPSKIDYSIGRFQITINIWYLIIFLLLQTLLNELGFWQLKRAQEKNIRLEQLAKGEQQVVTALSELGDTEINQFQSVKLMLTSSHLPGLLLDNKINNKQPGYHLLNIGYDQSSGKNILVNRGWVFAGLDRNKPPQVEALPLNWPVSARVYPMAEQSISTASAKIEEYGDYYRLPVLDLAIKNELEALTGLQIEDYLLRLDGDSTGALDTNWIWTNMPVEKHLGYAFQWFALALTLLIVSLVASIKKR